ncbi:MAG TPA: translation elongation factor 4 [Patescibacteria group bacterium]|nr:translation elongation factor 4 [Patescibacteria group bacterium]
MNQFNIRNFCIIAHIDHGKSTLADRFLEITGTVARDKIRPQMLDTMELERERGITIKLQPVTMEYESQISNLKSQNYVLNLIDTPGHVDFSYEVSRTLAACEGAILLVDATRGIQAQTLANWQLAKAHNLVIIPVINKIDLPHAAVAQVEEEIGELLQVPPEEILKVSAKTGEGVKAVLEKVIKKVPSPKGERGEELKALIFDSCYSPFYGAIAYVRVFEGRVQKGTKIKSLATQRVGEVLEVGEFKLKYVPAEALEAGEIGYLTSGAKNIREIQVGDTISSDSPAQVSPIPGFKKPQPMVFASFYAAGSDTLLLRQALEKLQLNDSSLSFEPENSAAFGQGFRCGFLGLLHLEIAKSRLEREYNLDLIVTQPQVAYREKTIGAKIEYQEPWVKLEIITPKEYLGPVMELAQGRRAIYQNTKFLGDRAILEYEAPLGEIIIDFYDKLKSQSSGYASQNYELIEWRPGDLIKLEVLIAGEKIAEFERIVPRSRAQREAKELAQKLKNLIPRQMFEVSIQVAVDGKILAREDISAMKKDVTAKLYGGDITRKNKLLKKQAAGKKRMKQIGKVQIPNNVFIDLLRT